MENKENNRAAIYYPETKNWLIVGFSDNRTGEYLHMNMSEEDFNECMVRYWNECEENTRKLLDKRKINI